MATTIYVATAIITVPVVTHPDLGGALLDRMVNTTGDTWVGSRPFEEGGDGIAIEAIGPITVQGSQFILYGGQTTSQALFNLILSALGPTRVKTGKQALTSPFRGVIQSAGAKLLRTISGGSDVGFAARTGVSGFSLITSTLEAGDDPADIEAVDA